MEGMGNASLGSTSAHGAGACLFGTWHRKCLCGLECPRHNDNNGHSCMFSFHIGDERVRHVSHQTWKNEEIGLAITYVRNVIRKGQPTNMVLLSQSMRCRDTLLYISAPITNDAPCPNVQGVILPGPIIRSRSSHDIQVYKDSERKALFEKCMQLIATLTREEYDTYQLPLAWTIPLFGRAPLCV